MEYNDGEFKKLGDVGTLVGGAGDFALIWKIVSEGHVPLSDIQAEWTLSRMISFCSYLEMQSDYKSAWNQLYKMESNNGRRE